MSDNKNGEIVIYRTPDGKTEIEVSLDNDTVWLTQDELGLLFQKGTSTISEHILNIYADGELKSSDTMRKSGNPGNTFKKPKNLYNLDVIISLGYRINSRQAIHFRIWATEQIKQLLVKGFVLNDEKLKGTKKDHFQELQERVRSIRTSERNFWDKIKDVFATTSSDYDKSSEIAKTFFATTQNMFHYAITHHTAAEIVVERANYRAPFMGLTTSKGQEITPEDAKIAKNYLTEFELKQLTLLADQFLSFAELQSLERRPMYMATWVSKLIDFLKLNDKDILQDKGKVSAEVGKQIALKEFTKYKEQQAKDLQAMLDEMEYRSERQTEMRGLFDEFGESLDDKDVSEEPEIKPFDLNKELKSIMSVPPPKKDKEK
ncbi:MAG: hypothetical protein EOP43_02115 [Sphingobacteriaceae bacterium]|nr:MAG: hypothetical protein EOP43_02115 [Sphingobacteriaceae bacterium]